MAVPLVYLPPTPDGRPAEPAPFLLTEQEVIRMLRLENGDPSRTLEEYRGKGWLKGTQVGRKLRYQLTDVLDFLRNAKERNPR